MKRKIFSKLLMVALVIASVSAFVSCKDYDDDINNLQKQIDAKAAIAQIESLQSQLASAQSAAQAAQSDATKALADAAAAAKTAGDAATAKALEDAIAKVNAAAEKAATENAAAIKAAADAAAAAGSDAAAAKTAADEAKAAAEKAYTDALEAIKAEIAKIEIPQMPDLSGYATKSEILTEAQIKALIEKNAQAKGEYVTATSLATQLDELKKTIPGAVDLTEINNAIASYDGAISALYSAVTSVELVSTYTGNGNNFYQNDAAYADNVIWFKKQMDNYAAAWTAVEAVESAAYIANGIWPSYAYTSGAVGYNEFWDYYYAAQNYRNALNALDGNATVQDFNLNFMHGKVKYNYTFGEGENVVPFNADETKAYVADKDIIFTSGLTVRVSPANADLTNAKVVLVNSLGQGLDDLIVAGTPVRANALITRGTNISVGSNVWNIPFTLAEGVTADDFNNAVFTRTGAKILYAIAVNNTAGEDADDRYVTSSYDVNPNYTAYVPATAFAFRVGDRYAYQVANRWDAAVPQAYSANEPSHPNASAYEYEWLNTKKNYETPNVQVIKGNSTANSNVRNAQAGDYDDRCNKNLYPAVIGQTFTVSLADTWRDANVGAYYPWWLSGNVSQIQWYYVTLDKEMNAVESTPSEWNAWKGYVDGIEGINKMTPAGEALEITINKTDADKDIIGFRIFAVNYDGSLADPDGRAFYVQVGDPANTLAVEGNWIADLQNYNFAGVANMKNATNNKFEAMIPVDGKKLSNEGAFTATSTATVYRTQNPNVLTSNAYVRYSFLKSDKSTLATKWSEVAYMAYAVQRADRWVDDGTATFTITSNTASGHLANSITVSLTKKLTAAYAEPQWRATMGPVSGVLTVYPSPSDVTPAYNATTMKQTINVGINPTAANIVWPTKAVLPAANVKSAVVDLAGYANNLSAATYDWTIKNVAKANGNNAADILIAGADRNLTATAYDNFVVAVNTTNIGSTFDSQIDAIYYNVKLDKVGGTLSNHIVTAWEGKVKFASLFEPTNGIVSYSNRKYNAWDLQNTQSKWSLVDDFYYFYDEVAAPADHPLHGLYDNTTAAGATTDLVKKYNELDNLTAANQPVNFGNVNGYILNSLFCADWSTLNKKTGQSDAEAKQTSKMIAQNSGLPVTAATFELLDYVAFGNTAVISDAAKTVMKATSNGTILTFQNIGGKHVTEKIKDQTVTVGAKDQFNKAVSNMSFKFTIVPETEAIANN